MTATITVVMPTVGRPTLTRAIASVVDQLEDGDELIVIGDSKQDSAAGQVSAFQPASVFYVEALHQNSVFGNAQRDFGIQLAAGRSSHLMFLDDDDVYRHGALDVVRSFIYGISESHVFRAEWGPGHHAHGYVAWKDEVVREQNIATPMVALPNRHYRHKWMDFNDRGVVSDFGWLQAAIGECAGVEWHTDVIATVRP